MRAWLGSLCICLILASTTFAATGSIHRMVVGKQALELQDTISLTTIQDGEAANAWISPDGRYVAYSVISEDKEKATARLCIVRASGGRSDTLLSGSLDLDAGLPKGASEVWMPEVTADCPVVWSQDSTMLAFAVRHVAVGKADGSDSVDYSIMVMTSGGLKRTVLDLPEGTMFPRALSWSPDSRRLACVIAAMRTQPDQSRKLVMDMLAFDVQRAGSTSVFSHETPDMRIESWGKDAKTLRFYVFNRDTRDWQLMESGLDGKPATHVLDVKTIPYKSPDGRMEVTDKSGLCVTDLVTSETKQIFKDYMPKVEGWTPDGKMLVYTAGSTIKDQPGVRTEEMSGVWLANMESHKLNHMCVALNHDEDSGVGFSRDNMKMAFVSHGRVNLASLGWAELTIEDKLDAGIPLTEEEEKQCLMDNAKQIGMAALMYADDNDGSCPSADGFQQQLRDYTESDRLFFRPGTDTMAFQYFYPGRKWSEIGNPAETMIGMFDVGYNWQVILYADEHVAVKPKN